VTVYANVLNGTVMKAVIYSRVSKISQSTQRQVNDLYTVNGFQVVKVFTESISGFTKSAEERPELQKAINYAKENNVEVLMVHEMSRLGRRTTEVLSLLEELKSCGIKVYVKSIDMLINGEGTAEPLNKFLVTIMTDIARMESEQMSYRIKSGLEERRRNGYSIGRKYGSNESTETFLSKHTRVLTYLNKGESIRWIATKLKISPTTVSKVKQIASVN
jgi:DNA invertase Pin-like site-specific DNA recombinase